MPEASRVDSGTGFQTTLPIATCGQGDGGERCGRGRWREQACGVSEEATLVRSASAGAARRRGTPPGGRDAVLQTASRNRGFLPRRRQRRWRRAGRGEGAGEER